ncbi:hypothetical protein DL93DRAFT_2172151 [Clavulina sp. PMI_390]|nr:hypothetical protein DL93DRAFT_2172151 [Clavulina sp. PMI_390]
MDSIADLAQNIPQLIPPQSSVSTPRANTFTTEKPKRAQLPNITGDSPAIVMPTSVPEDSVRSVRVTLKNYTNMVLSRHNAKLDGGFWSDNLFPPESIGNGTQDEPVEVEWASQSGGFMTGTTGQVVYGLGDVKSTMEVYWNNPYIGQNGWSVNLYGPLANHYVGSVPPVNNDNNARIEVTLRHK